MHPKPLPGCKIFPSLKRSASVEAERGDDSPRNVDGIGDAASPSSLATSKRRLRSPSPDPIIPKRSREDILATFESLANRSRSDRDRQHVAANVVAAVARVETQNRQQTLRNADKFSERSSSPHGRRQSFPG